MIVLRLGFHYIYEARCLKQISQPFCIVPEVMRIANESLPTIDAVQPLFVAVKVLADCIVKIRTLNYELASRREHAKPLGQHTWYFGKRDVLKDVVILDALHRIVWAGQLGDITDVIGGRAVVNVDVDEAFQLPPPTTEMEAQRVGRFA
jgi:hypothetical protein